MCNPYYCFLSFSLEKPLSLCVLRTQGCWNSKESRSETGIGFFQEEKALLRLLSQSGATVVSQFGETSPSVPSDSAGHPGLVKLLLSLLGLDK